MRGAPQFSPKTVLPWDARRLPPGRRTAFRWRDFLDVLDGRTTWPKRDQMTNHVTACWHCIDHFCRMVEVLELLRGLKPLTEAEAEPYRQLLGVAKVKQRTSWTRLLGKA
jgi:hypothetical protein